MDVVMAAPRNSRFLSKDTVVNNARAILDRLGSGGVGGGGGGTSSTGTIFAPTMERSRDHEPPRPNVFERLKALENIPRVVVEDTPAPSYDMINGHEDYELVSQYKAALGELTFNSKPIITNLTIIAGENLQAARGLAGALCNHILEVPKEQKLPALYLLDSIVKNIGGEYIVHFADRLPEVFVKCYRQVEPTTYPAMQHLFKTWRGVLPAPTLRAIETELHFPSINGPAPLNVPRTVETVSPSPSPRTGGIHVNPKYIEAQRLRQQQTGKDVFGADRNGDSGLEVPNTKRWAEKPPQPPPRVPVDNSRKVALQEKQGPKGAPAAVRGGSVSEKKPLAQRVQPAEDDQPWEKAGPKDPPRKNTAAARRAALKKRNMPDSGFTELSGPRKEFRKDDRRASPANVRGTPVASAAASKPTSVSAAILNARSMQQKKNGKQAAAGVAAPPPPPPPQLRHSPPLAPQFSVLRPPNPQLQPYQLQAFQPLISQPMQLMQPMPPPPLPPMHPISSAANTSGNIFSAILNSGIIPEPEMRPPPPLPAGPPPLPFPAGLFPGPPVPNANINSLLSSLMAQGLIMQPGTSTDISGLGTEFRQDVLRERHEAVINTLYADFPRQCKTCGLRFKGQDEHSKHMDWHVTRNRRQKSQKKMSRRWYVSLKDWVGGINVATAEVSTPPFFADEPEVGRVEEDDGLAVPADESQSVCALCGEGFEDFYSDETDEWMYKGAVYMNILPGTPTEGLDRAFLGPIVHAKCRTAEKKSAAAAAGAGAATGLIDHHHVEAELRPRY